MSPDRRCTEVEAVQIVTLHNEGYTQKYIARRLRRTFGCCADMFPRRDGTFPIFLADHLRKQPANFGHEMNRIVPREVFSKQ